VVVPEAQKALPTCWSCDVTVATAMAKLLVQGHRVPDGWRAQKSDGHRETARPVSSRPHGPVFSGGSHLRQSRARGLAEW
jgi:hypothetical protein